MKRFRGKGYELPFYANQGAHPYDAKAKHGLGGSGGSMLPCKCSKTTAIIALVVVGLLYFSLQMFVFEITTDTVSSQHSTEASRAFPAHHKADDSDTARQDRPPNSLDGEDKKIIDKLKETLAQQQQKLVDERAQIGQNSARSNNDQDDILKQQEAPPLSEGTDARDPVDAARSDGSNTSNDASDEASVMPPAPPSDNGTAKQEASSALEDVQNVVDSHDAPEPEGHPQGSPGEGEDVRVEGAEEVKRNDDGTGDASAAANHPKDTEEGSEQPQDESSATDGVNDRNGSEEGPASSSSPPPIQEQDASPRQDNAAHSDSTPVEIVMYCFAQGEKIGLPQSALNDDYCDCTDDGADETRTSACGNIAGGRFLCEVEAKEIFRSRVGDGVCDCCDGSDEAESALVLCKDTCEDVRRQREAQAKIHAQGAEIRAKYLSLGLQARQAAIAEGGAAKADRTIAWGPDDAYFPLTNECFIHKASGYEYSLCPFKSVTQQDKGSPRKVSLGSRPSFSRLHDESIVVMTGGDSCQGVGPRSTEIHFACGIENKITHVSEPRKCGYDILFTTPAACNPVA